MSFDPPPEFYFIYSENINNWDIAKRNKKIAKWTQMTDGSACSSCCV